MSPAPPATHRVITGGDGHPRLVKRAEHPATRDRLRGEAAVLRSLEHPGVVALRDLVEADEATELHLAWVGPHSLATVAGVPAADAARLVARVAEVVADLHRAGIGHGRLTADHVLLGAGGRPVLTGLAEARSVEEQPPTDDVAALGTLLCELVQPLDEGPAVPETRRARPRHAGLRAALLTLADHARADDPATRPDAAGLAERLRATVPAGSRRPARPRPPSAPGPAPPVRLVTRPARNLPLPPRLRRLASAARVLRRRAERRVARAARPSARHARAALGLVVAVAGTLAAATWIRPDGSGPPPAAASPTTTSPLPADPPSGGVPTSALPPPAGPDVATPAPVPDPSPRPVAPPAEAPDGATGPGAPACAPVSGPVLADIDADGCPDAVTITGERITAGGTTWIAGRPGDVVAVADWDCDGGATPASVRPATGEVFVFDRWAVAGEEVTVPVAATVDGAAALRPVDGDGDGCSELVVERRHGPPVEVEVLR